MQLFEYLESLVLKLIICTFVHALGFMQMSIEALSYQKEEKRNRLM